MTGSTASPGWWGTKISGENDMPPKKPKSQLSKSGQYYRMHPRAAEVKNRYNRARNKKKENVAYRVKHKKDRRKLLSGLSAAAKNAAKHKDVVYVKGKPRLQNSSTNRGKAEKSRLKGSKRATA